MKKEIEEASFPNGAFLWMGDLVWPVLG